MSGPTVVAEPALPEEREILNLPPKSYADAVEEAPGSPNDESNGNKENEVNGQKQSNIATSANGLEEDRPKHRVSVLRIVDTNGTDSAKSTDNNRTRPTVDRQESKSEYSATVCTGRSVQCLIYKLTFQGLDDTPKSPPRNKQRKPSSRKPNGTNANVHGPKTTTMSDSQNKSENTVIFEKIQGERNGSKLISVKPSNDYKKQLESRQEETPKRKDETLVSGRQAGQRWHTSGIRWAPMNVPLQRRLQTLVVLFHTLCIAIFVSSFFFLCAIPLFWPILIPYMIYLITSKASISGTMSHRSDVFRSLPVWSLFASYFPARLHRTQELPPTRKYIFGYHPHGIISHGAFAAFATEALGFSQLFPGIKNTLLTLDTNFRIPLYREYALAMGLASVSKESCENLLSKGGPNKVRSDDQICGGGLTDCYNRRAWVAQSLLS